MREQPDWRGSSYAILAAGLWATLGLFGKFLYRYPVDPLNIVALRAGIAALTLAAVLALRRPAALRIPRDALPALVALGVVGVGANYACYFFALKYTSMTTAVILLYTYPALIAAGSALFFKERITPSRLLSLGLALAGCFLVAGGYNTQALRLNLPGVLFSMGAALAMAAYALISRRSLVRLSGWTTTFYGLLFGALILLLLALAPQPGRDAWLGDALHYPLPAWLLLAGLAWGPTLLAYSFFTLAIQAIGAVRAALLAMLEPALAAALAFGVLGESLPLAGWAGAGLILLAALRLQFGERPQIARKEVNPGATG